MKISAQRLAIVMIVLGVLLAIPAEYMITGPDLYNGLGVASVALGFGSLGVALLEDSRRKR